MHYKYHDQNKENVEDKRLENLPYLNIIWKPSNKINEDGLFFSIPKAALGRVKLYN